METVNPVTGRQQAAAGQGLVVINTGNGKGKTTAALGLLLRAWGHNMSVVMLQFIKSGNVDSGEYRAARHLGLEIISGGNGFTRPDDTSGYEKSRDMAVDLWDTAKWMILSGEHDMVILDELSYPLQFDWIATEDVLDILSRRPERVHVVITGRGVPKQILEYADLVNEIMEIKHPYHAGVRAQAGIEF